MENTEVEVLKQQISQLNRAGLPFNPLSLVSITGANVQRLQTSMSHFGWTDLRFVSAEQAQSNGWSIGEDSKSVIISERDHASGAVSKYELFNAANVIGMPSLAEMLKMDNESFLALQGITSPLQETESILDAHAIDALDGAAGEVSQDSGAVEHEPAPGLADEVQDSAELDIEADDDEIEVGPARVQELENQESREEDLEGISRKTGQATDLFLGEPMSDLDSIVQELNESAIDWSDEPDPAPEQFAVSAPYWLDGLHNYEGIKHADEINRLIEEKKLGLSKQGVDDLLATYPDSHKFGLSVVEKDKHEKDKHRKANQAEPATLLKGALVRDKEGKYRPKEGGLPVIEDKGTSLKLKRKNGKAYEAAMELALSKGWKAIELNGKPKMLGQAWLEAKMKGLEVVNYTPTEKDREALAQRIAERDAAMAKEQLTENVEVRPVVDGAGREVMAKVTTTVEHQGKTVAKNEPLAAGKPSQQSTVTRTTTRLNDVVRTDVQPGVAPKGNRTPGKTKDIVQREIAEAVAEDKAEEVGGFDMDKGGILVEQGKAPYNHLPNAKESPFAVLVNDLGVSQTFWGQDLPRSIKQSGAEVGDKISLMQGERTPVTVPVIQADGTERHEVFNRVTWSTTVLSKAKAAGVDTPYVEAMQSVDNGLHIGPVMAIKDGMIGQKTGRDPNKLVWHEISKLEGKVPEIGEMAEIGYSKGKGQVKDKELERGVSR